MRKEWNIEEIDYLEEHIGVYKIETIAKKMDRSLNSVVMKINRLGLANTKKQTGLITIGELARHLKVDRNTVKGWVEKHGLPCTKKITRYNKRFYFIDPIDFWKWAESQKDKVMFSKIEPRILLPEPDWVEKERQRDQQTDKKRAYKSWTTEQDKRLVELRDKGLTYKEIGKILNRSAYSVEHRYKRIVSISQKFVNS